jgi:murein DD-endopeptidase MepM/ murein hydrolase activator NlpD
MSYPRLSTLAVAAVLVLGSAIGALLQAKPALANPGYHLPYPNGLTYTAYTHGPGQDQYAYDFTLGLGATVSTAHHGTVWSTKFDSNTGACDISYASYANFLTVKDSADTTKSTLYLHLLQNSAQVSRNQFVYQGRPLAGADNTGYSCGNHLHFALETTPASQDSCCTQSIPITFDEYPGGISNGGSYTSANRLRFDSKYLGGSEWVTLSPGATRVEVGQWQNTGWDLWRFSQSGFSARLGTWNPIPGQDQPSLIGGAAGCSVVTDWLSCNRIRPTTEGVDPDQTGFFQFTIKGPPSSGVYKLYVNPLIEGVTWMRDEGVFWQVTVP